MTQTRIFVSGFVQGVGYRYFVRKNAQKLKLTGWVRNLNDGRVEAVVQGEKAQVEKLIKLLHKGPILSEVTDIVVEYEAVGESYSDFRVKETV